MAPHVPYWTDHGAVFAHIERCSCGWQVPDAMDADTAFAAHVASTADLIGHDPEPAPEEPREHCGQCGVEILGCHACEGVPGGFSDDDAEAPKEDAP